MKSKRETKTKFICYHWKWLLPQLLALKIDRGKELRINPVFTFRNVFQCNQIAQVDEEGHFFTEECHQNVEDMIELLKITLLQVLMK